MGVRMWGAHAPQAAPHEQRAHEHKLALAPSAGVFVPLSPRGTTQVKTRGEIDALDGALPHVARHFPVHRHRRLTKTRGVHSNRTFGNGTKAAILGNNSGNSYRQALSARTAAAAEREAEKKEGVERTVIGTLVRVR